MSMRARRVILGVGLITLALPGILAYHEPWWVGIGMGFGAGLLAWVVIRD